jgi:curli biogenesis system outer membrane secretion channel CsgG
MNKYLFSMIVFLLTLNLSCSAFAEGTVIGVKKRVAVADFTIRQNNVIHGPESEEFARTATEKIINAFAALKRFTILDRTVVGRLQQEKQVQMLGFKTANVKADLGAVAKADIYCTGEVQNVSVSKQFDKQGQFLGYDGDVELQIKIYDLSTASLIFSSSVRGGTEIGGGLFSIFKLYQDTPSKAVFKSLNNAEKRIREVVEEAFPMEGKIVEILGRDEGKESFLISLGSDFGFKKGNSLIVMETSQIVVDGVSYPRQKQIGGLEITQIEPDGTFSEAKSTDNNGQIIIKKQEAGYKIVLRSKK